MLRNKSRINTLALRTFLVFAVLLLCAMQAAAADVPDGFSVTQVATGMTSLTRMELLPDGRILVCEQGGNIRVIENGVLRSTPFLTVDADSFSEHGLLGITLDPAFETNHSSTFTTLQKLLLCTTAWGVGELGPLVDFATSGVHTLRISDPRRWTVTGPDSAVTADLFEHGAGSFAERHNHPGETVIFMKSVE